MSKIYGFNIIFSSQAYADLKEHKKNKKFNDIKTIWKLLEVIAEHGEMGGNEGKPERLRRDFRNFYSRRINDVDRLVYRIVGHNIEIVRCKWHYSD